MISADIQIFQSAVDVNHLTGETSQRLHRWTGQLATNYDLVEINKLMEWFLQSKFGILSTLGRNVIWFEKQLAKPAGMHDLIVISLECN